MHHFDANYDSAILNIFELKKHIWYLWIHSCRTCLGSSQWRYITADGGDKQNSQVGGPLTGGYTRLACIY